MEKLGEYFEEKDGIYAESERSSSHVPSWMQGCLKMESACVRQAEAIMELKPILSEKQRVCSRSHIDRMEAYMRKHIGSLYRARPRITHSFFVLYAGQVAVVCKQNLKRSLVAAERQLIGTGEIEQISHFLEPPADCSDLSPSSPIQADRLDAVADAAIDSAESGKQDERGEPKSSNEQRQQKLDEEFAKRKLRCDALNALSEIKSIEQLVVMLGMDIQWEQSEADKERNRRNEQEDGGSGFSLEEKLEREMPASARENLHKLYEICPKFERIYSQNIMSIVRLTQMGFNPNFVQFDKTCRSDPTIQSWFRITVICNSLLRDKRGRLEWEQWEKKQSSRGNLSKRNEQIDDELAEIVSSPIDDKLTIGRYLPGNLSKLSSDFVKKIKRALHIEDDGVLTKSMETIGRYIAIALAMTVTLVTTGRPLFR